MLKKYAYVNKEKGFTLLEVLIGMSLLAVMMLLLMGSLRICIQNWDAGEKKIAEVNRLAVLQKFFSTHLQNIRPMTDNLLFDEPVFSFQGDEKNIQFVASMPASAGRMGLQVFSIGLAPGESDQGKNMLVSIMPFFPLIEGQEWKQEEVVVLEQVKKMQFRYFGIADLTDYEATSWEREWIDKEYLPRLIEVSIELANGEKWPQFVVSPRNEPDKMIAAIASSQGGNGQNPLANNNNSDAGQDSLSRAGNKQTGKSKQSAYPGKKSNKANKQSLRNGKQTSNNSNRQSGKKAKPFTHDKTMQNVRQAVR